MAAGDLTLVYGTPVAFAQVANLNSLATGQAKGLGKLSNAATKAPNYKLHLEIPLAAAGVVATGTLEVYLLESDDDVAGSYTDGIDPTSATDVAASLKNAIRLAILTANANSQVVRAQLDLVAQANRDTAPIYGGIVVKNNSGAALAASEHAATYYSIIPNVAS